MANGGVFTNMINLTAHFTSFQGERENMGKQDNGVFYYACYFSNILHKLKILRNAFL